MKKKEYHPLPVHFLSLCYSRKRASERAGEGGRGKGREEGTRTPLPLIIICAEREEMQGERAMATVVVVVRWMMMMMMMMQEDIGQHLLHITATRVARSVCVIHCIFGWEETMIPLYVRVRWTLLCESGMVSEERRERIGGLWERKIERQA